jgi:alpha-methylacyl-CoA racemase
VSIGALEPQFYAELIQRLGLDPAQLPRQMDRSGWPALRKVFADTFRTRTRDEWCALLEGTDTCFAPVLGIEEAYAHAHNRVRETFVEVAGVRQPGPAPRFSRTPGRISRPPAHVGEHTDEALAEWGFSGEELAVLRERKALA